MRQRANKPSTFQPVVAKELLGDAVSTRPAQLFIGFMFFSSSNHCPTFIFFILILSTIAYLR